MIINSGKIVHNLEMFFDSSVPKGCKDYEKPIQLHPFGPDQAILITSF